MPAQTAGEVNFGGDATQPGLSTFKGQKEVIGEEFVSDPCTIDHVCTPNEAGGDKAKRIGYEKVQEVKGDPLYAGRVPIHEERARQVYEEMMTKANLDHDEDVIKSLYGWGFGMKRQAISRAISSLKDKEATLDNIPEELAQLFDGRTFVHEQDQELHVYYSEKTIEMACTNGLYAIVAAGMHTKRPKELMQLYCVHGVCNGGVEVSLVYSMTTRKTEDVYLRMFGHLKNFFARGQCNHCGLSSISIAAVRRLFPEAKVEGCAFHLAQAWNRRRDTCNLRKFMQGHGRVPVVAKWWDTIRGVVFLPKRLYPEERALWRPLSLKTSSRMKNARRFWNTCIRRGSMARTRICGTSEDWCT